MSRRTETLDAFNAANGYNPAVNDASMLPANFQAHLAKSPHGTIGVPSMSSNWEVYVPKQRKSFEMIGVGQLHVSSAEGLRCKTSDLVVNVKLVADTHVNRICC
jgi:hypothetical protein